MVIKIQISSDDTRKHSEHRACVARTPLLYKSLRWTQGVCSSCHFNGMNRVEKKTIYDYSITDGKKLKF